MAHGAITSADIWVAILVIVVTIIGSLIVMTAKFMSEMHKSEERAQQRAEEARQRADESDEEARQRADESDEKARQRDEALRKEFREALREMEQRSVERDEALRKEFREALREMEQRSVQRDEEEKKDRKESFRDLRQDTVALGKKVENLSESVAVVGERVNGLRRIVELRENGGIQQLEDDHPKRRRPPTARSGPPDIEKR